MAANGAPPLPEIQAAPNATAQGAVPELTPNNNNAARVRIAERARLYREQQGLDGEPLPPSPRNGGVPNSHPPEGNETKKSGNATTSKFVPALQLASAIIAESGTGFGLGYALGKGKPPGVIGALFGISVVFGAEFYIRYGGAKSMFYLFGAILALFGAGLIPYMSMTQGAGAKKGKAQKVYLPTVAASWSVVAIIVCMVLSGGVNKADTLQGVILSLLYAAVSSAAGFSVATPGPTSGGNTSFAMMIWGALVMFDMAGLARE
jgi:hypothetical protein